MNIMKSAIIDFLIEKKYRVTCNSQCECDVCNRIIVYNITLIIKNDYLRMKYETITWFWDRAHGYIDVKYHDDIFSEIDKFIYKYRLRNKWFIPMMLFFPIALMIKAVIFIGHISGINTTDEF